MKVHVCIPAYHNQTHTSLITGILSLYTDIKAHADTLSIDIISTPLVSYSRNFLMEKAKDADWVLMWDTDVELHTRGFFYQMLDVAQKNNAQMVGVCTRLKNRGEPEFAVGRIENGEYKRLKTLPDAPFEVDFVAGGVHILDNKWVQKSLTKPYYEITDRPDGTTLPEDWDLCAKIKSNGGRVYADPTIINTHWGMYGWTSQL